MEFAKVASGEGTEVHQAIRRVPGKPKPTGEELEITQPELPTAIDAKLLGKALSAFEGREVLGVQVSVTGGVQVRVRALPPRACADCGHDAEDAWTVCPFCGGGLVEVGS